jgi:hypothetical protein
VFECKRQYASYDADKKKAIDSRLDEIAKLFPAYATSRGWAVSTTRIFILSFYGGGSGSKFPIYDRRSVASLFPPCAVRFTDDFIRYSETIVSRWCAERLDPNPAAQEDAGHDERAKTVPDDNLFEMLEREAHAGTDRFEVNATSIRAIRDSDG